MKARRFRVLRDGALCDIVEIPLDAAKRLVEAREAVRKDGCIANELIMAKEICRVLDDTGLADAVKEQP